MGISCCLLSLLDLPCYHPLSKNANENVNRGSGSKNLYFSPF